MELKQIQELIKLVKKSELSELSIQEGDFSITIKNKSSEIPTVIAAPVTQAVAPDCLGMRTLLRIEHKRKSHSRKHSSVCDSVEKKSTLVISLMI